MGSQPEKGRISIISRRQITTVIRLRTRHGCYPVHFYKIEISRDAQCQCRKREDLNRILFSYGLYYNPQLNLYQELTKKSNGTDPCTF